jgi:HK97 family phage major capsid protein
MSTAYLRTLVERRATLTDAATAVLDKCAAESSDPSPEQRAQLAKWDTEAKTLDAEIAQIEASVKAGQKFADVIDRIAQTEEASERRHAARREAPAAEVRQSVGEKFVGSEAFKTYNGRGTMAPVEFDDFLGLEQRAAIDTATLNIPPILWDGLAGPRFVTPLLQVIGREVVSSGSIEYMTWSEATGAAVVAEGAVKPEATLTPTTTPLSLDTYAYWKAITRQALEDYPRVRSIVENKLRQGLARTLEGAAATELATVTNTATGVGIAGIREAIGEVQGNGFTPNAIALSPSDFAALDIDAWSASSSGSVSGPGTYWGLRPVSVPQLPPGVMYVGDFAEGITWFDRGTASVYMTDSHADYFVRNLLVILAEQRSAFALTEPGAMYRVGTTVAPVAGLAAASTSTSSK